MNRTAFLVTVLFACVFARLADASVLLSWDWNDGTTQGWVASSSQSNVGDEFQATNSGNGSLQMFGPLFPRADVTSTATVSFDLTITAYSTVTSPGELSLARLVLQPRGCPPTCPTQQIIYWDLDLSNLAFGQMRRITLSLKDAIPLNPNAPPADLVRFSFIFAHGSFDTNVSTALLDNFIVVGAPTVDIPAVGRFELMLVAALIVLVAMPRLLRRR